MEERERTTGKGGPGWMEEDEIKVCWGVSCEQEQRSFLMVGLDQGRGVWVQMVRVKRHHFNFRIF